MLSKEDFWKRRIKFTPIHKRLFYAFQSEDDELRSKIVWELAFFLPGCNLSLDQFLIFVWVSEGFSIDSIIASLNAPWDIDESKIEYLEKIFQEKVDKIIYFSGHDNLEDSIKTFKESCYVKILDIIKKHDEENGQFAWVWKE